MTSDDLTKSQAKQLRATLAPMLNFLYRLERRMEKKFKGNDPLYRDVQRAYDAMQALSMSLHYLKCDGTGSPTSFGAKMKDAD